MSKIPKIIIHPITLHGVTNIKGKYISMPIGKSRITNEQNFFDDKDNNISEKHEQLFLSDSYFFKAIFGAETIDDIVTSIKSMSESNDIETMGYILKRFITSVIEANDQQIYDISEIYIKYYSDVENKIYTPNEMNDTIRNQIAENKLLNNN